MSDRTALLTESDDDGGPPGGISAPQRPGISLDLPPLLPQKRSEQPLPKREREEAARQPQADGSSFDYDIIDADDKGRPLSSTTEGGEQLRGDENQGDDGQGADAAETDQQPRRGKNWERKQRQREAYRAGRDRTMAELEAARGEIEQLRQQVAGFAPRFNEIDQQRLNERRSQLENEIGAQAQLALAASKEFAAAVRAADDDDAIASAMQKRDAAIIRGQELQAQKRLLAAGYVLDENGIPKPVQPPREVAPQPQAQPQGQPPAQRMDPLVRESVQDFADRHPWYNPQSDNPADLRDTEIALALDRSVAREGFDPRTQDYWDELDDRLSASLPHRFGSRQRSANGNGAYSNGANGNGAANGANGAAPPRRQPPVERRGPMVGGPSERSAPSQRPGVYLTPGRKEALIQKGLLDRDGRTITDRKRFDRMMQYFHEHDQENGPPAR